MSNRNNIMSNRNNIFIFIGLLIIIIFFSFCRRTTPKLTKNPDKEIITDANTGLNINTTTGIITNPTTGAILGQIIGTTNLTNVTINPTTGQITDAVTGQILTVINPATGQVINPITIVKPPTSEYPVNPQTGLWEPVLGDYIPGRIEVDRFTILDNGSIVATVSQGSWNTTGKLIAYLPQSVSLEDLVSSPKLVEMIFKSKYPKINVDILRKPSLKDGVITATYTVSFQIGPITSSNTTFYDLIITHEISPEDTKIAKIEGISSNIATNIQITHGNNNDGNITVTMAPGVDPTNIFANLAPLMDPNEKPVFFLSLLVTNVNLGKPGDGKFIFLRNKKASILYSATRNSITIIFGSNPDIQKERIYNITYITGKIKN